MDKFSGDAVDEAVDALHDREPRASGNVESGSCAAARLPLVVGGVSANLPLELLGPPLSRSLPGQEGNAGGSGWVSKSRAFAVKAPLLLLLVEMSQML